MAYRKFKADRLFNGFTWEAPGSVLVTDENGRIEDIVREEDAGDAIALINGVVCPGLINAHCHLELSHLQHQIPERTGMVDFLLAVMGKRGAGTDLIVEKMIAADLSMQQQGIVAVGDICNTSLSVPVKKNSPIHYHSFVEVAGLDPAQAETRLAQARKTVDELRHAGRVSITPHAPYSVSGLLLQLLQQEAPDILSIHSQESKTEEAFFQNGTGELNKLYEVLKVSRDYFSPPHSSSLKATLPALHASKSILLVHSVTMSAADLEYLIQWQKEQESTAWICLCAGANWYINRAIAPVDLFAEKWPHIVLGTDSLASNYQLSIAEEMHRLSVAFPAIEMEVLLKWATSNGARALQMQDKLGSFEKGKTPGIVQIDNWHSVRLL